MKSILQNSRKHDISFFPSGRIDISAHIARFFSLSPGDVIDIAQSDGELYIYVKYRAGSYVGRHQGKVWPTSNGRGTFRTYSTSIVNAVLSLLDNTNGPLRFPCGAPFYNDSTIYIPIIYRCPL